MVETFGKFMRPLSTVLVEKLAQSIDRSHSTPVISTDQQCVYLQNALAKHPDLADCFTTIIINLRREMKASRLLLHKPRPPLPPSGPTFRQPSMRNFQNIQVNPICPESDNGSEDDSEEDAPRTTHHQCTCHPWVLTDTKHA